MKSKTSWKTTVSGLLSGSGLLFASTFPEFARWGVFAAGVGAILQGMAGRDNNVTSEQAGAKGDRQGTFPLLIAGLLLFSFCAGCKTATPEKVLGELQLDCQDVTEATVTLALIEHPAWRADFEKTYDQLDTSLANGTVTQAELLQILDSLKVKELKNKNVQLSVVGARILFRRVLAGTETEIASQAVVTAAATGIRDGMKNPLGK